MLLSAGLHSARGHAQDQFEPALLAFEAADRQFPPPSAPVVFAGSSSIHLWPSLSADFAGLPVLNRGISGSTYADLLALHPRLIVRCQPRGIVLYSGDNDLAAGWDLPTVFWNFTNLVTRLRQTLPDVPIAVLAIKPSPSRLAFLPAQRGFNEAARRFCHAGTNLHFVDVFSAMLDQTGQPRMELYGPDRTHLSPAGYALWRDLLWAEFRRWGWKPKASRGRLPLLAVAVVAATLVLVWRHRRPSHSPSA